ncbi:MAG: hypothetical protein ACRD1K_07870 [Acidimicrobiales bacterium]
MSRGHPDELGGPGGRAGDHHRPGQREWLDGHRGTVPPLWRVRGPSMGEGPAQASQA